MTDNTGATNIIDSKGDQQVIDFAEIFANFRRYSNYFFSIAALVATIVILPLVSAQKLYTSTGSIMLDPRSYNETPGEAVVSGLPIDTTQLDTEVEVLKSSSIANAVIESLNLDKDPEFNGYAAETNAAAQVANQVTNAIQYKPAPSATEMLYRKQALTNNVLSKLAVRRNGLTRIIEISYTSLSAEKSARIVNEWARVYLEQQVQAKLQATRGANEILSVRLDELRNQVLVSDEEVQRYKLANGLLSTDGRGLTEQEISNYSQQASSARAELSQSEARLATAKRQMSRGSSGDDLGEALSSAVIQTLRGQRAQKSAEFAQLDTRYGPRHPEIIRVKKQLEDIDNQINAEIRRIVSNLSAQVDVQRQKLEALTGSLNAAKGTLETNNVASVKLRQLETNAEAVRALYESYLNRYKETAAEEGSAKPDARVVSPANLPTYPSSPRVPLTIALGLILGTIAGVISVFVRRLLDFGVNSGAEAEKYFYIPHIANIATLKSTLKMFQNFKGSPFSYIKAKPLSAFAEGFRTLRASLIYSRAGKKVQVIAITSSVPKEGKTTTTVCLAQIIASSGQSVVVVDCDLRRHSISSAFNNVPETGLLEYIAGDVTLDDILIKDSSGISYIPIAPSSFTSQDVFGSDKMVDFLNVLKARFDVVILDTAPVLPVVDTRILARLADATVLLCAWRKTPRNVTKSAINLLLESGVVLSGVALTKMDVKQQSRYGYGDSVYYRSKAYNDYYVE